MTWPVAFRACLVGGEAACGRAAPRGQPWGKLGSDSKFAGLLRRPSACRCATLRNWNLTPFFPQPAPVNGLAPSHSPWSNLALRSSPRADARAAQVRPPTPRPALIARHSPPARGFAGDVVACPLSAHQQHFCKAVCRLAAARNQDQARRGDRVCGRVKNWGQIPISQCRPATRSWPAKQAGEFGI